MKKGKKDPIQLSDHFTYSRLLKFTLPSVGMMIFTSIYGVVDGFFVSNFAGKTPFAAVNLIFPLLMILSTAGFMFGTGGSAVVAKAFGMGKDKEGNDAFSLFTFRFWWSPQNRTSSMQPNAEKAKSFCAAIPTSLPILPSCSTLPSRVRDVPICGNKSLTTPV